MGNIFKKSLSVYDTWFGFYGDFKKGTLHVHMNNAVINGLINGVYYQPVPLPQNVVVATSSVPDPTVVKVQSLEVPTSNGSASSVQTAGKPKVRLEFAMPEQPPAKKTARSSHHKSRSSPGPGPDLTPGQFPAIVKWKASARAIWSHRIQGAAPGRGKKRWDMPTTPILVPTSHSHLMTVPKPKKGLTITFSTDTHTLKVETTVQHLERLAKEASTPLIVTPKPSNLSLF